MPTKRKTTPKRAPSKRTNVRPQPLVAVRDVPRSSRWYARLLGAERTSESMRSDHAHVYDRLLCGGSLVLQLHAWDEEEHPNLVNAKEARSGHGVLLWFEVEDFDAAVKRVRALRAKVLLKPFVNPAPGHREIWIEDPDGYVVVIVSPDGEAS